MNLEEKFRKKEAEYNKVHRQFSDLRWKYEKATLQPRAEKLVGTVWKYRNSYSCPQTENDYWELYLRVVRISAHGYFECQEMQIDCDGQAMLKPKSTRPWESLLVNTRYEKATPSEWKEELKRYHKMLKQFELKA